MKTLATLAMVAALAGCTHRDWSQPMTPQQTQALGMVANQWQNQIYQNQMLNLQRQQLYNAQHRQTTRCSTLPNGFGGFQMVCP